jgi:hypothetical protein
VGGLVGQASKCQVMPELVGYRVSTEVSAHKTNTFGLKRDQQLDTRPQPDRLDEGRTTRQRSKVRHKRRA